jgi:hypothetical protein
MQRTPLLTAAVLVAALAACDGSPTGGASAALTPAEAELLAGDWDAISAAVMDGFDGPTASLSPTGAPATATVTAEFTRTRQCPGGGTATVQGTRPVTHDPQTGAGSAQLAATRTDAACTFAVRRGGGGTLSITTTPTVQVASQQAWSGGEAGVRTATQQGSFDWTRSTGASGSCTVDLVATWTPSTRTYTLDGTFCARTVHVTRTRTG